MGELTHNARSYSEVLGIQPIYCSGLAHVSLDNGNLHFSLYQEIVCADGTRERTIVLRVIMPEKTWVAASEETYFQITAAKASHRTDPSWTRALP